mgnify:CR=1 FL=1
MLEFKKITIDDRENFLGKIQREKYRHSQASFTTLFAWRKICNVAIAEDELAIYVKMESCAYQPFCMPPFLKVGVVSYAEPLRRLEEHMMQEYHSVYFKCFTDDIKQMVEKELPGRYLFTEDRNNADYIYLVDKLISLSGKKLHAKRNHINAFLKEHPDYEYEVLTRDSFGDCLRVMYNWVEQKEEEDENGEFEDEYDDETRVIKSLFHNFDKLELKGGMIKIDGEIKAFTIGSSLNDETVEVIIEKADANIRGLYPMINREFLQHEFSDKKYANRQEDMGIPGLRKAKLSYNPYELAMKYDAVLAK